MSDNEVRRGGSSLAAFIFSNVEAEEEAARGAGGTWRERRRRRRQRQAQHRGQLLASTAGTAPIGGREG